MSNHLAQRVADSCDVSFHYRVTGGRFTIFRRWRGVESPVTNVGGEVDTSDIDSVRKYVREQNQKAH